MLRITPHMRTCLRAPRRQILVATEPVDFRKGIDGLACLCREALEEDPFGGTVFVFRNRRGTAPKVLVYDGQGFWLCHKRLSEARFRHWPSGEDRMAVTVAAHELTVLLAGGDPSRTAAARPWRPVRAAG